MSETILTNSGVIEQERPLPINKKELKEKVRDFNNDDEVKERGLVLISKSTLIFLWTAFIVFGILFISFGVWFNISFSEKDFTTSIPVQVDNYNNETNVINTGEVTNHHTIEVRNNNTIIFPEELIDVLDELTDKLQNGS